VTVADIDIAIDVQAAVPAIVEVLDDPSFRGEDDDDDDRASHK
jgi:hypothetical protein